MNYLVSIQFSVIQYDNNFINDKLCSDEALKDDQSSIYAEYSL